MHIKTSITKHKIKLKSTFQSISSYNHIINTITPPINISFMVENLGLGHDIEHKRLEENLGFELPT